MSASAEPKMSYVVLSPGDPAPWFAQASTGNPRYTFDTAAGRYVVLGFYGSAGSEAGAAALAAVERNRTLFDDERIAFFGVSLDPTDRSEARIRDELPGIRHFLDFDWQVSRLYGAVPREAQAGSAVEIRPFWLVLDPTLRVIARIPFTRDGSDRETLFSELARLPPPDRYAGFEVPPPILVLPNVFEPALCRELIALYERQGGEESGFMREVDGRTTLVHDHAHKRRRDVTVEDPQLVGAIQARIRRRVAHEIKKIFHFDATRMERYIVSCYAAEDGGHFRAHRDNTTRGTAHRRFAVSINLNAEFEGGEVSFPEYGKRSFKAPPGGAVIFPCALLHAVSRVTSGRRFAFLPFLYDEAAAKLREANSGYLSDGGGYRADTRAPAA
ncbi:2OG-Fe(II) oxygenase [Methylorubrum salsuginis]|uniref:Predicted 2-oxoglutarate-and Fe(II)-dependent dioxygenase YbiX n=1 Tax=Methylorubrum salsuginis TaxID=414703 RepID=A0A1I4EHY0_9HYPH|nr:2OG-Fe(II) oxygenase [Methylorubrum salsuginis]SFL05368.1 Predicted 2-oxoglutarate-and Fe(II)-dependent dioxygenase YbiX [Methylorubrum salsuginis]